MDVQEAALKFLNNHFCDDTVPGYEGPFRTYSTNKCQLNWLVDLLKEQREEATKPYRDMMTEAVKWINDIRKQMPEDLGDYWGSVWAGEMEWLRDDLLLVLDGKDPKEHDSEPKPLKAPEKWQPIETAPKCVNPSPGDNGRRPVIVCRWPVSGGLVPMAIARLTQRGWISGRRGTPLWFEPTRWRPLPEPPTE